MFTLELCGASSSSSSASASSAEHPRIHHNILALLVFGNKIVHAFASVPVKECLASEHSGKLLSNSFGHLLNSS